MSFISRVTRPTSSWIVLAANHFCQRLPIRHCRPVPRSFSQLIIPANACPSDTDDQFLDRSRSQSFLPTLVHQTLPPFTPLRRFIIILIFDRNLLFCTHYNSLNQKLRRFVRQGRHVTTNRRSSFTAALGMMFIDYFISPECNNHIHNTSLYRREKERDEHIEEQ